MLRVSFTIRNTTMKKHCHGYFNESTTAVAAAAAAVGGGGGGGGGAIIVSSVGIVVVVVVVVVVIAAVVVVVVDGGLSFVYQDTVKNTTNFIACKNASATLCRKIFQMIRCSTDTKLLVALLNISATPFFSFFSFFFFFLVYLLRLLSSFLPFFLS
uniref:Uncharacterized protein n=1 Tax=Octopus bimaculoides TaxID=37653 RepID=A0A0L8IBD7_OCTBM